MDELENQETEATQDKDVLFEIFKETVKDVKQRLMILQKRSQNRGNAMINATREMRESLKELDDLDALEALELEENKLEEELEPMQDLDSSHPDHVQPPIA